MSKSPPFVSVVAPVYNEEASINAFLQRLTAVLNTLASHYRFEIILVSDGSTDRSVELILEFARSDTRVRLVDLSRNFGQTAALQAGIDAAQGDVIMTLDADLQHFPEDIPIFLNKLAEGYDVVCGWRAERQEGAIRRWPSKVANWLMRLLSGLAIHDFGTTFRAYRPGIIKHIKLLGESHRYIPLLAHHNGARIAEIPIRNVERPMGKSNYGIGRTLGVTLDLVLLFFLVRYIDRPFRAFGKIALLAFVTGFAIIATLVIGSYIYNTPLVRERSGWFILSTIFLLASVQILLAGLLAELLVRIHYAQEGVRTYQLRQPVRQPGAPRPAGH